MPEVIYPDTCTALRMSGFPQLFQVYLQPLRRISFPIAAREKVPALGIYLAEDILIIPAHLADIFRHRDESFPSCFVLPYQKSTFICIDVFSEQQSALCWSQATKIYKPVYCPYDLMAEGGPFYGRRPIGCPEEFQQFRIRKNIRGISSPAPGDSILVKSITVFASGVKVINKASYRGHPSDIAVIIFGFPPQAPAVQKAFRDGSISIPSLNIRYEIISEDPVC